MKTETRRVWLAILIIAVCTTSVHAAQGLVNFAHLDHLTEKIVMDGDTVSIVHIYANYPDYHWVDAKESGPEGIACVDDAARAAVVYLRRYELTHDRSCLATGRSLLKFIMKMQAEDGEFYNFIFSDHSINRTGKTSFKSFGWWAARGLWSMAIGYRICMDADPAFASVLRKRINLSLPHIAPLMKKYGEVKTTAGLRIPQWLLYESGADVTSELVLGLIEYYRASGDARVGKFIRKLSNGMIVMQDGDAGTFPYGLHRSWETMWHAWGNSQSFALAYAGATMRDTAMLASAKKEAECFYSRLLITGLAKEWDCTAPGKQTTFEQIAYGVRPMALALLRLYDATGDERYTRMAGLSASWLFGSNVLHQVMYDSTTGRCFDGITDSTFVNRNSGAESTIEALFTLVEIDRYPLAKKYLSFRKIRQSARTGMLEAEYRNDDGETVTLISDTASGSVTLTEGKMVK